MDRATRAEKQRELDELRAQAARLEAELRQKDDGEPADWRTSGYYLSYYATAGFFLGMAGALTSLLFNVFGSLFVGQHPLYLIQVYLTFGMGEKALAANVASDGGLALAIGCCLYVGTGMLLGVLFHVVLTRYAAQGGLVKRLMVATVLALAVWVVNYYLVLAWLQPLLFGGNWIVTKVPVLIAAMTHLVFGWTQALVYPWGLYEPYRAEAPQGS
ncbi:MAG: hypothetical protein U0939_08810 [Pirellulales bacterium]